MKLFACFAASTWAFEPMMMAMFGQNPLLASMMGSNSGSGSDSMLNKIMMMQAFGGNGGMGLGGLGSGGLGGLLPLMALMDDSSSSTSSSDSTDSSSTGSIPAAETPASTSSDSTSSSSSSDMMNMMIMQSMMGGGNNNPLLWQIMMNGEKGSSDDTLNALVQMNMMNQMGAAPGAPASGGMGNIMDNPMIMASLLGGDSSSDGSGLDLETWMLMSGGLDGGLGGGLGGLGVLSLLNGDSSTSTGSSSSGAGVFEPTTNNMASLYGFGK